MSLIFCSRTDDAEEWRTAFSDIMPDLEFRVWPDILSIDDIHGYTIILNFTHCLI